MKRATSILSLILFLYLIMPLAVHAEVIATDILIVELQTTGAGNTTDQEFVEIYNTTNQAIDISNWQLQYQSSTGTTWSTKATLQGILYPESTLLIASNNYLTEISDISFASGFKQDGGHVRLISPNPLLPALPIVHDLIGWGLAVNAEGFKALAATAGESLQRKVDIQGLYIDTNDNSVDFAVNAVPTPQSQNIAPAPVDPLDPVDPIDPLPLPDPVIPPVIDPVPPVEPLPPEEQQPSEETPIIEPPALIVLSPLQITELLPNPAPPLSDSSNEYVEIFNPNNEAVDLSGYKLQSGNSYSYSYTFDDETIPAHGYAVLYVSESGLLLANTSGKARLLDPNGQSVSETSMYEGAADGFVWILSNGIWQWSTSQTPAAANILTGPIVEEKVSKASVTSKVPIVASKKIATAKVTAPKVKAVSTAKPSSVKSSATKAAASTVAKNPPPDSVAIAPLHPGVIAVVSIIAVGYAAYEYRQDFSNRLYQFRRYREARREARESA